MKQYDYLIIGAGMTADAAAQGIRERDPKGTIGIIGADPNPPYNRPPLTKALWKGDGPDTVWRNARETGAELVLGRRVVSLDTGNRRATDDADETYEYEKLLLATGGDPRRLPDAPEGVIYFRTLDDYRQTRGLADGGARFVVLGGGFIGSEIAAALRLHEREVTMVVPENGISARVFPPTLSAFVSDYYRRQGVKLLLGDLVQKIERRDAEYVVHTKHGSTVTADAVIAGLGILPNVALAQGAQLEVDDGIVVDPYLRTGRPEIYAAGDVARFYNPSLDRRLRVEHEDNANTMGRIAGRNMAGGNERYDHLPFFYSDLFDLGYEAVGLVDARIATVADWKQENREGVVYYVEGGRVRGVLLWNTWGQVDAARALIAQPGPFSHAELMGKLPVADPVR
jgi:NADPH-dependent 2,4-dienoyl-CoA reductase/sulfur reductase-like enzyme